MLLQSGPGGREPVVVGSQGLPVPGRQLIPRSLDPPRGGAKVGVHGHWHVAARLLGVGFCGLEALRDN